MSDLQWRRAIISGVSSEKGLKKLIAKVSFEEVGKYSTVLSSLTNWYATFSIKFTEYSPVSHEIQDELL